MKVSFKMIKFTAKRFLNIKLVVINLILYIIEGKFKDGKLNGNGKILHFIGGIL